jgi:YafQ family addiction module toxin component
MYSLKIREELDKTFSKLAKRDPIKIRIIHKKIIEILENPHRFKNLRAPLNEWKRVHIDSHFVLAFSVDENTKTVTLEDYDHHDNIYK